VLGQRSASAHWIIDPEALIVGTVHFGRYDPRLFDAAIEWCLINGKLLNSARIQRLQKHLPPDEQRILSAIASLLLEVDKSPKWIGLVNKANYRANSEATVPLFLSPDGSPLPQVGKPDAKFLRYGLLRPPLETREISINVPMGGAATLQLRLRAFIGVASRAEILLYLITHKRAYPRLVARQVNYAHPPIAKAMAEMALSGLLDEHRSGREVEYELDASAWLRLFRLPRDLSWVNWGLVFLVLRRIWACTGALEGGRVASSILGSELLQCAQQINPILRETELGFAFVEASPDGTENFPDTFFENVNELIKRSYQPSTIVQEDSSELYEPLVVKAWEQLQRESRVAARYQTFREIVLYPSSFQTEMEPREKLLQWLTTARTRYRGNPFPWIIRENIHPVPEGITYLHDDEEGSFGTRVDYWRLLRSGFFYYAELPWEDTYGVRVGGPHFRNGIGVRSVVELLFASARLALRLYKEASMIRACHVSFRLRGAAGRHLVVDDPRRAPFVRDYVCSASDVITGRLFPLSIGESDLHNEILSMAGDIFWMFGWAEARPTLVDMLPSFEEEFRRVGYGSES
jgi:hypothetical protein